MPFKEGDPQTKAWAKEGGTAKAEQEREMKAKIFEWADFGRYIRTRGIEKAKEEMETLQGKDYISAFVSVGDFFEPKLARTDNTNKNVNVDATKVKTMTDEEIEEALRNAQ